MRYGALPVDPSEVYSDTESVRVRVDVPVENKACGVVERRCRLPTRREPVWELRQTKRLTLPVQRDNRPSVIYETVRGLAACACDTGGAL